MKNHIPIIVFPLGPAYTVKFSVINKLSGNLRREILGFEVFVRNY